jgi:flagellar motor switch protein FliN
MSNQSPKPGNIAGIAAILAEITGSRPSMSKAPAGENPINGDMLWWHSSGASEIWIGATAADAALLLRLRERPIPPETPNPARAGLADIFDRAWGPGEISVHGPADPTDSDVYDVQFATGEKLRFFFLSPEASPAGNLDMLMDIELPITIRFGSRQMALRDVVQLSTGSIIEFDRRVDEPVEVMVNGHVVALGEAVTVQGSYGIRISEISSRRERLITSSFATAQGRAGGQVG